MKQAWVLAVALSACFGPVAAQTSDIPVQAPTPPPAPSSSPAAPVSDPALVGATVRLAIDTPVKIELAEAVSSNGSSRGDKFAIRLAAPIVIDGRTVAPAGITGQGEVVYAEPGGAGGSPGKLVLAARYLDMAGVHIRLKAFNLSAGGESNFREMQVAAEFLGPAVMFINGHNVLYPVGTRARAKIAEDVMLAAGPPAAPANPPTASSGAVTPAAPLAQESPK